MKKKMKIKLTKDTSKLLSNKFSSAIALKKVKKAKDHKDYFT